jgi:hypothetical protein
MARSTKDAWLQGPGDLREEEVHDVPVKGASVLVRGLPARYSAEVQGQLKLEHVGREQVAKIDVPSMELLQFVHGCVDPKFTPDEVRVIQERYGPAFKKVIAVIDRLSGVDKEAIERVEQTFPAGGAGETRPDVGDGTPSGNGGPDLHVRTGA